MADTYFDDGTHLTSATLAGTEAIPMRQAGGGDAYATPVDLKGYIGVISNASTITTGNLTCAENNVYNCTIAGLTADRNAVLPAPSAAGKIIRLNILDGDADYELIVIGDTGVTINGGSAATEWSRLFIAGESVTLESTNTTNWNVIQDGRIPCKVRIENTDAQSIPNNSITVVVFDEISKNVGGGADTGNYRINIRRAGYYIVSCGVRLNGITAAGTAFVVTIQDNAGARVATDERAATNGRYPAAAISAPQDFSAGQYVEATAYQNTGAAQNTMVASTQIQYLALTEILP